MTTQSSVYNLLEKITSKAVKIKINYKYHMPYAANKQGVLPDKGR